LGIAWSVPGDTGDEALLARNATLQVAVNDAASELGAEVTRVTELLHDQGLERFLEREAEMLFGAWHRAGTEVLIYQGDSLVFWSGRAPVSAELLAAQAAGHVRLSDGAYLHAERHRNDLHVHGLRLLWYAPPIENEHLMPGFDPSLNAPHGMEALFGPGVGPVIRDGEGEVIFRTGLAVGSDHSGNWQQARPLLAALGMTLLLLALWLASGALFTRRPLLAVLALLTGFLAPRFLAAQLGSLPLQEHIPLFDPGLYAASSWFPSLGDLLIDLLILLALIAWCRTYLLGLFKDNRKAAAGILTMCLLLAHGINRMLHSLVADSRIPLDLYGVQGFNGSSALAILAAGLMLGAWVLKADLWARALPRVPGSRYAWVPTLAIALVFVLWQHMIGVRDLLVMLWPFPLLAIVAIARRSSYALTAMVGVLAICAGTCAHAFTKSDRDRAGSERGIIAERLLAEDDPVVELLFREVSPRLSNDLRLYSMLSGGTPCTAAELDRSVRQEHFSGYWERYDVRLYAYDLEGRMLCATDPSPPEPFPGPLSFPGASLPPADMPNLSEGIGQDKRKFFHARIAVMANDTVPPGQLVVELHPRLIAEGLGYPDLLISGQERGGLHDHWTERGRYDRGVLVESSGSIAMPMRWESGLVPLQRDRHVLHPYGDPKGQLMVLCSSSPTLLDMATAFSYLFAIFSLLVAAVVLVFRMVHWRTDRSISIATKVRAALVLFSMVVLVFFGVGAQRLLSQAQNEQSTGSLLDKARSVHAELQRKLAGAGPLRGNGDAYLDHVLGRLSNIFFTDIHVYRRNGRVYSSSRPQLFASGLVGPWMDPTAFHALTRDLDSYHVHQERLGTTTHRAAYMPLRDPNGVLLGYLGLPSFGEQARAEQERASVIVAVSNLFVLLFALSVLVAVFISNWTTRPLDLLRRSLSKVALTGANEPLRYRGQDEVGTLVEVYNQKVEELRQSAEQLARSQRESAWREMARQVAHEIKNPLTPMKLSIQHFQRSWDPSQPDAQDKLERFGQGLVHQIDVLSRIAGEFSHFAQMPPAHPEEMDLREVATSAIQLFHGEGSTAITLDASGPVLVHADKEHLLRVFNNLLKNAVQAIPEERKGRISVRISKVGAHATIAVADNGSGIPPELHERVFEPNFTTRNTGMGLGLAMVRRIVEHAGGRVRFETMPGQGTTFFVELPLRN
ncbi:MAG: GHKL domain-containing protein, partial [Flavobacteriales bacterium]|nr:GHKL domain-containing protein [Flavobacteriales bacterium]